MYWGVDLMSITMYHSPGVAMPHDLSARVAISALSHELEDNVSMFPRDESALAAKCPPGKYGWSCLACDVAAVHNRGQGFVLGEGYRCSARFVSEMLWELPRRAGTCASMQGTPTAEAKKANLWRGIVRRARRRGHAMREELEGV